MKTCEAFVFVILISIQQLRGDGDHMICPEGDRLLQSTASSADFTATVYTANSQTLSAPPYAAVLYGSPAVVSLPSPPSPLALVPVTVETFRFRSMQFSVKGVEQFRVVLTRRRGPDVQVVGRPYDPSQWQSIQISLKGIPEISSVRAVVFRWTAADGEEGGAFVDEILLFGCAAETSLHFTSTTTVTAFQEDTDVMSPTEDTSPGHSSTKTYKTAISLTSVLTSAFWSVPESILDTAPTSASFSPESEVTPLLREPSETASPLTRECDSPECSQGDPHHLTDDFVFIDLPSSVDPPAFRHLLDDQTNLTVQSGATFRGVARVYVSVYTVRLSVRTQGCQTIGVELKDGNNTYTFTEEATFSDESGETFCLTLQSVEPGGMEAFSLTFNGSESVTIDSIDSSSCSVEATVCPPGYRRANLSEDFTVAMQRKTVSGNSGSDVFGGIAITMDRKMYFKLMRMGEGGEGGRVHLRRVRIFTEDWADFKLKYRLPHRRQVTMIRSRPPQDGVVEMDLPPEGAVFKSWFVLALRGPLTINTFTVKWIEVDACLDKT